MIVFKHRVMQLYYPSRRCDRHSRAVDANVAAEPAAGDGQPGHVRIEGTTPADVNMTGAAGAGNRSQQQAHTEQGTQHKCLM